MKICASVIFLLAAVVSPSFAEGIPAARVLESPKAATYRGSEVRVLVIPYHDKTWEHKDAENVLTSSAVDTIKASGMYSYVSADKFAENWLKVLTDSERKLFTGDPASQMKDLKAYRPMFRHEDLGTLQEYRARWGTDMVILGDIRLSGEDPAAPLILHSEIINMETGRFYAVEDEFKPDSAKDLAGKQVSKLLKKSADTGKVLADGVIFPPRSVVGYDIRASDGNYLRVVIDYSSNRPFPDPQKVEIIPHSPRTDGILPFTVKTREGKPIRVQFFYRGGQFINMKISTDPPPSDPEKGDEREETLSVVSRGGYLLRFTFHWKGGEVSGIRIEPEVNPYGEVRD